jgi:uncharacterized membrane protein YphA (DoxX/SURF4 family)
MYAVGAVTLLLTGAGRFSVDGWLARRRAGSGDQSVESS